MIDNILVVYKKNFEEVHDQALESIRNELEKLSENVESVWIIQLERPLDAQISLDAIW